MSVIKITSEYLSGISCPEGYAHYEIFDSLLKGFYVDVLRNGRMHFRVRYRFQGNPKVITLGDARVLTVEEAREAARAVLRKAHAGHDPKLIEAPSEGVSIKEFFLTQYLTFVKSYKRSWATDESMIRNHVIPRLGARLMAHLTQGEIAQAVNELHEAGYAPGTCNRFLVLMRYGFTLAVRWGSYGIARNPAKDLSNLRDDNRIERYLTMKQLQTLFQGLRDSPNQVLSHIIHFLILTGARKREVLDAQWTDVDFEQRLWRIPKTKSGKIRHIPLSTEAIRLLSEVHSSRIEKSIESPYVFCNPATGKPFVSIYYSWNASRKRAGMPEFRIHDLRHSFASFLVNAGRSLYEVQQLLGHADIRTTSRYAHLSMERLVEAVESIPVQFNADGDQPK